MKDIKAHIRMKWLDFKFSLKKFFLLYGTTARKFTDYTEAELNEIGLGGTVRKTQK